MPRAVDVLAAVGPSVCEIVGRGGRGRDVLDVVLTEPGLNLPAEPGDLLLGLSAGSVAAAAELIERYAASAAGLVLRRQLAADDAVRAAAAEHGLPLAALTDGITWSHLLWVLRGVIDRAAAPDAPAAGDGGVYNDLFLLADAAAAIVDAPVTIEDHQSRVLAYSSGQATTDEARVSTIIGRRVPRDVVSRYRAQGVFRRMVASSEPFLIPRAADGMLPRLVVPVRAGDEWLGSIWAVVSGPVPPDVIAELRNAAAVLALHLLRLRAQANVARRHAVDQIRSALLDTTPTARDLGLPPRPWRVVALGAPGGIADVEQQLDLWSATFRRNSWADPQLADVQGNVFAIVTAEGGAPGSWGWLGRLIREAHAEDSAVRAAAGRAVTTRVDLPRSRIEATEALALGGPDTAPVLAYDDAWIAITNRRAVSGLRLAEIGGPVTELIEHDREFDTAYLTTLRSWLRFPGDPRRAARELHVHPNTLRHRMKRLAEVIDVDLADPAGRLALQLQLEVAVAQQAQAD